MDAGKAIKTRPKTTKRGSQGGQGRLAKWMILRRGKRGARLLLAAPAGNSRKHRCTLTVRVGRGEGMFERRCWNSSIRGGVDLCVWWHGNLAIGWLVCDGHKLDEEQGKSQ